MLAAGPDRARSALSEASVRAPEAPPRGRREQAAALLTGPLVGTIARRLPRWRGVIVLNYHRIGDQRGQPWDRTLWNVDAEAFDTQLATLARHADVVTPEDLTRLERTGRPGRRVLLTFDDGYRDNHEIAYPLLRSHGLTATFFPTSGFLDRGGPAWWDELAWMVRNAKRPTIQLPEWFQGSRALGPEENDTVTTLTGLYKTLSPDDAERFLEEVGEATGAGRCDSAAAADLWMSWDMVRELQAGGMQIGGHTVTHPVLARLPIAGQEAEIDGCAARLLKELGRPMSWFAYPVGARDSFTSDTKRILEERGVQLAFSFHGGFGSFRRWDPLSIPRVHVGASHGPELMQAMLWLPRVFTRR